MRTHASPRVSAVLALFFLVAAAAFAAVPFPLVNPAHVALNTAARSALVQAITTEDVRVAGSLTALWNGSGTAPAGSVVSINAPAGSVLAVNVSGTFVATLQFEGTLDGTNWFALTGTPITGGAAVTSATSTGQWNFSYAALLQARVRCSAYTSGTAVVTMRVSSGAPTASATLSGTVAVTQSTSPWVTSGTVTANQGGAPWSVTGSGTFGVTQSTSPWVVSQNATFNTAIPDGTATGSLAGTDQAVTLSTAGFATATFQIATNGTWNGTVNFEASNDNATWIAVDAVNLNTGLRGPTYTTTNTNALFRVVASGLSKVRVRANPYVAGTATITAEAGMGSAQYGQFVQGSQFAGATVAQSPVIVGMNGASGIRYLTEANAVFPTTGNAVLGVGPGVWDATNWQKLLGDTSGRPMIVGAAASGAAVAGNPLLIGVSDATNAQTVKQVTAATATTGAGIPSAGPLLWDLVGTTNFVKQAGDGSGRAMVVGAGAAGAALAGNPLRVGVSDGTNAQDCKQPATNQGSSTLTGIICTAPMLVNGTTSAFAQQNAAIGDGGGGNNIGAITPYLWNGASMDRQRDNVEATLLASASRTTTQTSADIVTYNTGAIVVVYDNTVGSTYSDTLTINGKDPASGKYYLLLSSAAIATVTTNVYTVDPAIPAVANVSAQKRLPRTIQIVVTAGNANAHTYSIGYCLQPT